MLRVGRGCPWLPVVARASARAVISCFADFADLLKLEVLVNLVGSANPATDGGAGAFESGNRQYDQQRFFLKLVLALATSSALPATSSALPATSSAWATQRSNLPRLQRRRLAPATSSAWAKELATLFSVDVLLCFVYRRGIRLMRTHPPAHAEGAWQALPLKRKGGVLRVFARF